MNTTVSSHCAVRGSFIQGRRGRLYQVEFGDSSWPQVLVAHGFGDEMNKSRTAVTALATRLNQFNIGLVCLDPFGTGDSDGDFSAADIDIWIADLSDYIATKPNCFALLGIRLGCALLACIRKQAWSEMAFYCWAPRWDAAKMIKELLRAKSLSLMMSGSKESTKSFVARLERGETVDAGGYDISADMWRSAQRLADYIGDFDHGQVFELGGSVAEGSAVIVDDLPFWNSAELRTPQQLIDITATRIAGSLPQ